MKRRRLAMTSATVRRPSRPLPGIRGTTLPQPQASAAQEQEDRSKSLRTLQRALEQNRKLQSLLQEQREKISRTKIDNRNQALGILQALQQDPKLSANDISSSENNYLSYSTKTSEIADFYQRAMTWEQEQEQIEKEKTETVQHQTPEAADQQQQASPSTARSISFWAMPPFKAKQFQYQPFRKWNSSFFIDPTGSQPRPNLEVFQRKKLRNLNGLVLIGDDSDGKATKKRKTTKSSCGRPSKWTKPQTKLLLEQVNRIQDQSHNASEPESLDWKAIAECLTVKNMTPWDCMSQFVRQQLQQQLDHSKHQQAIAVISPEQEEILLRYWALLGPQQVWDVSAARYVAASRLLLLSNTTTTTSQIPPSALWMRSNYTATLNPKLTHDPYWNEEQEKRLVLLMKIYHPEKGISSTDADNQKKGDDEGNEEEDPEEDEPIASNQKARYRRPDNPALTQAAAHFPDRTQPQIRTKWERSLDPSRTREPFTPQEDARLKRAVQENATSKTIGDVARTLFPHRTKHQVYERWLQIASPEEIVSYDAKQMLLAQSTYISTASHPDTEEQNVDNVPTIAIPSFDQFQIQFSTRGNSPN